MPPKRRKKKDGPDSGNERATFRCGLFEASLNKTYVTRLTAARVEAEHVALHTYGIIKTFALMFGQTVSGEDEFISVAKIDAIQRRLYPSTKNQTVLGDEIEMAVRAYTQRIPRSRITQNMFSGLSQTLMYQATTIHTAISNDLKYGTFSRQVAYLQGKYGLSRGHAKIIAQRIGTSVNNRAERALLVIKRRAYRALCQAQKAHSENPEDARLLRVLQEKEKALQIADARTSIDDADALIVLAEEYPLPAIRVQILLREVLRREYSEVPTTNGERDQLAYAIKMLSGIPEEDGVRRFSILPYPKAAASFIRFDKKNLYALLKEKKPQGHWLYAFFSEKKIKKMLTNKTTVGRSCLTDGVQLQISVNDKGLFEKETLKFEKMARKRNRKDTDAAELEIKPPPPKKGPAANAPTVPPKQLPYVKDWKMVSAVDPGHSNPFTAAFPQPFDLGDPARQGAPFRFETLTLGQYYQDTGYNKARRILEKKKRSRPDVLEAESSLPTLSTIQTSSLLDALAVHTSARPLLSRFYSDKWFLRQKFRSAILKEKVVSREAKRICPTKETVVAFGNAKFAATRRGLRPAVCGRIKKELLRIAGDRIADVDEFRTSKLCSHCRCTMFHSVKKQDPETGRFRPVHGLFQCPNTRKGGVCKEGRGTWNRDENAAINIWKVFHSLKTTGEPPDEFVR